MRFNISEVKCCVRRNQLDESGQSIVEYNLDSFFFFGIIRLLDKIKL